MCQAQLLTAPAYCCGAISAVVVGFIADRVQWRMPFIVGSQSLLVLAFSILFAKAAAIADNVALCYVAVCIACTGVYPILPGCNAWTINNLYGLEKRNVSMRTAVHALPSSC
jgi:Na+/melibiose symporter-like transporter